MSFRGEGDRFYRPLQIRAWFGKTFSGWIILQSIIGRRNIILSTIMVVVEVWYVDIGVQEPLFRQRLYLINTASKINGQIARFPRKKYFSKNIDIKLKELYIIYYYIRCDDNTGLQKKNFSALIPFLLILI